MLAPQSPAAEAIARLWWWMFAGGLAILALVMGLALFACYGRRGTPSSRWGHRLVLSGGLLLPLVLLTPLLVHGLSLGYRALMPAADALVIDLTGHRFWWEVRYPGTEDGPPAVTANELPIPAGRPVLVRLHSADVIHSFWVPSLGGKKDLVPGRVNEMQLLASRPGVYRGQCAEFCGDLHAHMELQVIAMEPERFAAWREHQARPAETPEGAQAEGLAAFLDAGCGSCHRIRGSPAQGSRGPDLTHVASRQALGLGGKGRLDARELERWIQSPEHLRQPAGAMPDYAALPPQRLRPIAAYLESLK